MAAFGSDEEQVLEIAGPMPVVTHGVVEVRPLMDPDVAAELVTIATWIGTSTGHTSARR